MNQKHYIVFVVVAFLILGVGAVAGFFIVNKNSNKAAPTVQLQQSAIDTTPIPSIEPQINTVKDCGTTTFFLASDPGYGSATDPALICLGKSILNNCESAKIAISGGLGLAPQESLEIRKNQNSCYFKLSHDEDDYIQCPIHTVKVSDESSGSVVFKAPDTKSLGDYAASVYTYAKVMVYAENNFNQSAIQNIGCSGGLIASTIQAFANGRSSATVDRISSSVAATRATAEMYYASNGNTYKDVCKTKLITETNKLKTITGVTTACLDSANSYAFAASLPLGGFYCADASGFADTITKQITGTNCQ